MGTVTRLPDPPSGVLGAVSAAVKAMTWLTPSDAGMVALALAYAKEIDEASDPKSMGYLGQNLTVVLRALGGAPADRKALGVDSSERGKLKELRAARRQ